MKNDPEQLPYVQEREKRPLHPTKKSMAMLAALIVAT